LYDEQVVTFAARQLLDIFAPTNLPWTNPEMIRTTLEQGGNNFVHGLMNFWEDWERIVLGHKPVGTADHVAGKTLAITRGKVVYPSLFQVVFFN
jgi:polyhydroxyalkanoate synthase